MDTAIAEPQTMQETVYADGAGLIDCDVHPALRAPGDLDPFLSARWRAHRKLYPTRIRQPFTEALAYPRIAPAIARADAWPPSGLAPGADLDFMREQHLDVFGIEYAVLIPLLRDNGWHERNIEYGAALCSAVNQWQIAAWLERDSRLRGSIVVSPEHPEAAIAEIQRHANDRRFVQVTMPPRTVEPLGRLRYRSIFAAAAACGLPVGFHVAAPVAGHPSTGGGWASYYFEDHYSGVTAMEALVISLVVEGVFEEISDLRIVLIEAGFAWLPALGWRLDKHWKRLRDEVPHLRRAPSEYIRDGVWCTTQPVDEPEKRPHLIDTISWTGWDRIMFSSDYPHWDFDDPRYALKIPLSRAEKRLIFHDNAHALYRLG
jgi:predicted TIM-barrel fold metal-dependent hydrolase